LYKQILYRLLAQDRSQIRSVGHQIDAQRKTLEKRKSEVIMKKRLAILTATAVTALGAASGASAIVGTFPPQPHNGAPSGAQCGKGSVACTAGPSGQSAPVMNNSSGNQTSSHGSGYSLR
jgi:hypothetical protein